jgi:hypothetical protein
MVGDMAASRLMAQRPTLSARRIAEAPFTLPRRGRGPAGEAQGVTGFRRGAQHSQI